MKRLEEEICNKVEKAPRTKEVKLKIHPIIEERNKNFMDGITLQL